MRAKNKYGFGICPDAKQEAPRSLAQAPGSASLASLLDDCDAAMTAAGAELWNQHRDLSLQLNKLAARCRVEIKDMQPNNKLSHGGPND